MAERDILGPLLDGERDLREFDDAWLTEALRAWYPGVIPRIMVPHWRPGEPDGLALWWPKLGDALREEGATEAELADWEVAADVNYALDHPLEKLFEAVQFVRRAVLGLREVAVRRDDRGQSDRALLASAAMAHAFACIDVMDDDYDLRAESSKWAERLRGSSDEAAPKLP